MSTASPGSPSDSSPLEGAPSAFPTKGRKSNDSLWKRARRTLGTNSLTFLQPQNRLPKGGKSAGVGPAAPSKRREQVRHAQRTHRQRTQNYIKTLETEVIRLRNSENTLNQDKNNLQGKFEILRTTCLLAGIPLPAGVEDTATPSPSRPFTQDSATVSFHADEMSNQRLHVHWPLPEPSIDPKASQSQSQMSLSDPSHSPYMALQPDANQPSNSPLQPLSYSAPLSQLGYSQNSPVLDSPDNAIDFVLALEHPCMTHIPHPSNNNTPEPSNHILLASTPLVSCSANPPQLDAQWNASASMIKELLNLSSSINLDGEMTPVEAWHRLRSHPNFRDLDQEGLGALKRDLSRGVRCCGFGAVLDETFFLQTLGRVLRRG